MPGDSCNSMALVQPGPVAVTSRLHRSIPAPLAPFGSLRYETLPCAAHRSRLSAARSPSRPVAGPGTALWIGLSMAMSQSLTSRTASARPAAFRAAASHAPRRAPLRVSCMLTADASQAVGAAALAAGRRTLLIAGGAAAGAAVVAAVATRPAAAAAPPTAVLVNKIFDAINQGKMMDILDLYTPTTKFTTSWDSTYVGPDGFLNFAKKIDANWESDKGKFTIKSLVVDGDQAVAIVEMYEVPKKSKGLAPYTVTYADYITFKDGKLVEFIEIGDPTKLLAVIDAA